MRALLLRFVLLVMACAGVRAADAERFELSKGLYYFQITPDGALLQTKNPYRFNARVNADVVGDLLGASIITPKNQVITLDPAADGDPFEFRDKFQPDDRVGFENHYPNGVYQFTIRGAHDGEHTMSFTLTGDTYPAAPVLNDYAELQNLDASQYNQIFWQPFSGGSIGDYIQVQVEDIEGNNIWETSDFGEPGALTGVDTRALIPPNTLTPGVAYFPTLRFMKVLFNGSRQYVGVPGTVGYFSRTELTMGASTSGVQPLIDRLQLWRSRQGTVGADGQISSTAFRFRSKVDVLESNKVSAVSLTLPGGTEVELTTNVFNTEFSKSDDAIASYPPGQYTFGIGRFDGATNRYPVTFPSGEFPPFPSPQNIASFAGHPADQNLVVSWQPWTNATAADFIRVELFQGNDKVWDTPNYNSLKHLRASATSVTIPSTNLLAGADYSVVVSFLRANLSDTRSVPGALTFGGFDSSAGFNFTTRPADVAAVSVELSQHWREPIDGIYEPDAQGPYLFRAIAEPPFPETLLSAQITTPNGDTIPLSSDGQKFTLSRTDTSLASLQNQFPAGDYRFGLVTLHDGNRTIAVNLFTNQLPPRPTIRNFNTVRSFAESGSVSVRFDPWVDANPDTDSIILEITNIFAPTGKSYTAVTVARTNLAAIAIPANTLSRNSFNTARLRFERKIQSEDPGYPTVPTSATVSSEVVFTITTTGFRAGFPTLLPSGDFRFNVANVLSNKNYVFYLSDDLKNWTPINFTTNRNATNVFFTNAPTAHQFFRAEVWP